MQAPGRSRAPAVIVQEPDSEGEGGQAGAPAADSPNPYYPAAAPGTSLQHQPLSPPAAAPSPAVPSAALGDSRGRMAVQETVVCHMYAGRDGAPAAMVQQKIKVTEVTQPLRIASGGSYQPSRQGEMCVTGALCNLACMLPAGMLCCLHFHPHRGIVQFDCISGRVWLDTQPCCRPCLPSVPQ